MKIILVSKCSLDIEQYVQFKMTILISPVKSLISSRWVTNGTVRDMEIAREYVQWRYQLERNC